MPSAWITTRRTKGGAKRYRVAYRLGGRESQIRYAGTFRTGREATTRKRYVVGELAAMRVPNLTLLEQQAPTSPLLSDACEAWRRSRIDVTDGTRTLHRVALGRVLRTPIATKRLHEITVNDVVGVVAELADAGAKRETIKRAGTASRWSSTTITSTPARRETRASGSRERKAHLPPPLAEHVERVAELLPRHYVLPLLILDTSGARVNELATAQVGDLDEHRQAIRVRPTVEKNDRYRHLASHCPTTSLPRCSPRCRHARTAPPRRRCSPTSTTPPYAPRSRERARRSASRASPRTRCAAGAARCTTTAPARSSTSPPSSATASASPRTTTSTRSPTTARSTAPSRSPEPSPDVPSVRPRATPGASPAQETRRFAGGSETSRAHSTDPERR